MRDRAFGVEIECYFPGGPLRAIEMLRESGMHHWAEQGIHSDGSGTEIPSPILRGTKGLAELEKVMRLLREAGAYTTSEDGLHVHHDAPEFVEDDELVTRLVATWGANQDHISNFVAEYRRRNHWACETSAWKEASLQRILAQKEEYRRSGYGPTKTKNFGQKFHALNISSLDEHGTIEFRQHEGTLDFDHAKAWIMFGQAFLDSVKSRKKVLTCSDSLELLKRVRVARSAEVVLMDKAANPPNIEHYDEDHCERCGEYYDYCACCYECGGVECECERCTGCDGPCWECYCSVETIVSGDCSCSRCVEEREWQLRNNAQLTMSVSTDTVPF